MNLVYQLWKYVHLIFVNLACRRFTFAGIRAKLTYYVSCIHYNRSNFNIVPVILFLTLNGINYILWYYYLLFHALECINYITITLFNNFVQNHTCEKNFLMLTCCMYRNIMAKFITWYCRASPLLWVHLWPSESCSAGGRIQASVL